MTREIEWVDAANRDLRRLGKERAARVVAAVERFASESQGDVKRVRGRNDELRLRVGDLRVLFALIVDPNAPETRRVQVRRILPREHAYRG